MAKSDSQQPRDYVYCDRRNQRPYALDGEKSIKKYTPRAAAEIAKNLSDGLMTVREATPFDRIWVRLPAADRARLSGYYLLQFELKGNSYWHGRKCIALTPNGAPKKTKDVVHLFEQSGTKTQLPYEGLPITFKVVEACAPVWVTDPIKVPEYTPPAPAKPKKGGAKKKAAAPVAEAPPVRCGRCELVGHAAADCNLQPTEAEVGADPSRVFAASAADGVATRNPGDAKGLKKPKKDGDGWREEAAAVAQTVTYKRRWPFKYEKTQRLTPRRQTDWQSALDDATRALRWQRVLERLADEVDGGSLPPILWGLTNKTQVGQLLEGKLYGEVRVMGPTIKTEAEWHAASAWIKGYAPEVERFTVAAELKLEENAGIEVPSAMRVSLYPTPETEGLTDDAIEDGGADGLLDDAALTAGDAIRRMDATDTADGLRKLLVLGTELADGKAERDEVERAYLARMEAIGEVAPANAPADHVLPLINTAATEKTLDGIITRYRLTNLSLYNVTARGAIEAAINSARLRFKKPATPAPAEEREADVILRELSKIGSEDELTEYINKKAIGFIPQKSKRFLASERHEIMAAINAAADRLAAGGAEDDTGGEDSADEEFTAQGEAVVGEIVGCATAAALEAVLRKYGLDKPEPHVPLTAKDLEQIDVAVGMRRRYYREQESLANAAPPPKDKTSGRCGECGYPNGNHSLTCKEGLREVAPHRKAVTPAPFDTPEDAAAKGANARNLADADAPDIKTVETWDDATLRAERERYKGLTQSMPTPSERSVAQSNYMRVCAVIARRSIDARARQEGAK